MFRAEVSLESADVVEPEDPSGVGDYIEFDAGELRVTEGTPASFPSDVSSETRAIQQLMVGLPGTNAG